MASLLASALIAAMTPSLLMGQTRQQPESAALSIVPRTFTPVLLDGRCESQEWLHSARTRLDHGAELLLQQDGRFVYLCVRLPPASYGTMDLYISSTKVSRPVNLHASAQVGERQLTPEGWPEQRFGNQRGWYSPPVALSSAEIVDGRIRLAFDAVEAREVVIEKSKFGMGPWRFLFEIRALGPDKRDSVRYPASASVDAITTWAALQFSSGG